MTSPRRVTVDASPCTVTGSSRWPRAGAVPRRAVTPRPVRPVVTAATGVGSATGACAAAAAAAATAGRTARGPAGVSTARDLRCAAPALRAFFGRFTRTGTGAVCQMRPEKLTVSGSDIGDRRYQARGCPR
ncbi:hypothetical protein [Nonomuraea roseoviolacea]|uniref:Uncharacterized protein n=1 Tax=Nonomuraea roseoviolacea subsp. carminata TaxID=160689 RepID=A0ABT1K3B1_9ACTN|nr:hypothetical protein [Nonomuraea roseoviolacea]MCP2348452.1 hypothetical protein [Nonomuraea roseoviolacea subsp. carminata]